MAGWIKLYRQITNSSKFADPDILRLWILCLTKASHKESTVTMDKQEIKLLAGQFITGRYSLSEDYNAALSPRKRIKDTTLWSWLKRLEEWGDLDINSTNKYSIVSVVKWTEYQETLTTEPQQIDNKLTTEPQQIDTNKNVKKEKNVKKVKEEKIKYAEYVSLLPEEYEKLIQEYGDDMTKECIDILNTYKGSTGKTYKSDYMTMTPKSWVPKRYWEDQEKKFKVVNGGQSRSKASGFSKIQQMYAKAEEEERNAANGGY